MQAVYKAGGGARQANEERHLELDRPSIVSLKIAPESVARFERRGDDLVLVLRNGDEVAVRQFFAEYPDGGRNDLVLQDEAGVFWWGQYHAPWSEFHFTEIEWDDGVPLLPVSDMPGWLLAGLGVLGVGALAGGGGGGGGGLPFLPPQANRPPEAPSYQHATEEDRSVSGRVVGNDPDGDPLTYTTGTPPSHGTVVLHPDGSYTYTPDPDYHGPDSFTVIVDDGRGGTTTSTVTIEVTPVNDPPTAPDYDHTTPEDTPISGRVTGGDVDGDPLTYTAGTPPSHGTVVVNPDGSYTYTPDPDYHGSDSFTVIVDDGHGGTTTSTVTIEVTPANDPVTADDDAYTVAEDTPVVLDLLGNDSAPDGGLHITGISGVPLTPGAVQSIPITDDGTPTGTVIGTLEIDAGGTITFVPAPNYNGPVSFEYEVADADGDTDTATVSIDVTPANDPPTAPDYDHTTPEDTPVSGQVTGGDVDGDTLTYTADTPPSHGTVVVNPDGSYTYTPDLDYHGPDSFTVIVDDGNGGTTISTVTIEVTPVNDPPQTIGPIPDQTGEDADTGVSVSTANAFDDVDGDTLGYTATGLPPGLTIDPA
ncbi:MAG: tandem-95 repeat protein, partial [Proteobacteria bacterium]|nr:tandem-95 repeat protein [Pseudomonadota bacterium]